MMPRTTARRRSATGTVQSGIPALLSRASPGFAWERPYVRTCYPSVTAVALACAASLRWCLAARAPRRRRLRRHRRTHQRDRPLTGGPGSGTGSTPSAVPAARCAQAAARREDSHGSGSPRKWTSDTRGSRAGDQYACCTAAACAEPGAPLRRGPVFSFPPSGRAMNLKRFW